MKLIDKYLNVLFESRQNVEFIFWWDIFFVFVHAVVLLDAVVFINAVGFIDAVVLAVFNHCRIKRTSLRH